MKLAPGPEAVETAEREREGERGEGREIESTLAEIHTKKKGLKENGRRERQRGEKERREGA